MVNHWVAEFKIGQTSANDDPCVRRLIEVHKIVFAECRMKVSEIAQTAGISTERVCNILHKHLFVTKLHTRRVLRLLKLDQNHCQKDVSTDCLSSDIRVIQSNFYFNS